MGEVITTKPMIDGVAIHPLKQIKDDRGSVMHILRKDDPWFKAFGEVYFSSIKAGVVKAWKRHSKMIQSFAVPVGEIDLVVYDDRPESKTKGIIQKITVGVEHYGLVQIPSLVWYGFKGVASGESLIVNCASMPHDPSEVERIDVLDKYIPYDW